MITVSQLIKAKGSEVYTVAADTSVSEVLKMMAERNIGAVPVVESGNLIGIFSERDYARQVAQHERLLMTTPVRDLMTTKVCYVHPGQTIEDCMALMTDKRIRHLPVLVDERELVGIVSIGDIVKSIISQQEFIIDQLENYIMSSG